MTDNSSGNNDQDVTITELQAKLAASNNRDTYCGTNHDRVRSRGNDRGGGQCSNQGGGRQIRGGRNVSKTSDTTSEELPGKYCCSCNYDAPHSISMRNILDNGHQTFETNRSNRGGIPHCYSTRGRQGGTEDKNVKVNPCLLQKSAPPPRLRYFFLRRRHRPWRPSLTMEFPATSFQALNT